MTEDGPWLTKKSTKGKHMEMISCRLTLVLNSSSTAARTLGKTKLQNNELLRIGAGALLNLRVFSKLYLGEKSVFLNFTKLLIPPNYPQMMYFSNQVLRAKLSFFIKCINSVDLELLEYGSHNGITMLGKVYKTKRDFKLAYFKLIYFSYRSGMSEKLVQVGKEPLSQDTSKLHPF